MNNFFTVKVEFTLLDESKGKMKKQKVQYLVDAMSCVEAEANTVEYLTDRGEQDFEVVAIAESKIAGLITPKVNEKSK
jgi:hypothetical protein